MMPRTLQKYEVVYGSSGQVVKMPAGATPLRVTREEGEPRFDHRIPRHRYWIWALAFADEQMMVFPICFTNLGEVVPPLYDRPGSFVGIVVVGITTWHVFVGPPT